MASAGHVGGSTRIPYLDGFRALAAIFVVVYHVAAWQFWVAHPGRYGLDVAAWVERMGNYGVCVFFLLSGLVLYRPFAEAAFAGEPAPKAVAFYSRRVLRIYPAYVVALTAWYALAAFPMAGSVAPDQYIWQYLLLQNHVSGGLEASLPIAWTLSVEVMFYAALPIIAAGIRRLPGGTLKAPRARMVAQLTGLAVLALTSLGFRLYILAEEPTWGGFPSLWLLNFLDWFSLGMLLAVLHAWRTAGNLLPRWLTSVAHRPAVSWGFAFLLFWLLVLMRLPLKSTEDWTKAVWRVPISGMSAWFLLLPAVIVGQRRRVLDVLEKRPLVFLGVISYGIYLWHLIVLRWIGERGWSLGSMGLLGAVLVGTVALAFASYRLVERPVQELGRAREVLKPAQPVLTPTPVGG